MRISRPYIPIAVRIQVAARQLRSFTYALSGVQHPLEMKIREKQIETASRCSSQRECLTMLLYYRWRKTLVELHHRPALVNRMRRTMPNGRVDYSPDANDPAHLVYLPKGDHDVETRVRGLGAQRSDLGQRRYNKKVAKNRAEKRPARPGEKYWRIKRKLQSRPKDPKRPSRWPKRKLRSKPINARWRRRKWPKRSLTRARR